MIKYSTGLGPHWHGIKFTFMQKCGVSRMKKNSHKTLKIGNPVQAYTQTFHLWKKEHQPSYKTNHMAKEWCGSVASLIFPLKQSFPLQSFFKPEQATPSVTQGIIFATQRAEDTEWVWETDFFYSTVGALVGRALEEAVTGCMGQLQTRNLSMDGCPWVHPPFYRKGANGASPGFSGAAAQCCGPWLTSDSVPLGNGNGNLCVAS